MSNVAIAIPVYNEIESIEIVIKEIKKIGYYFFVVDNNSTDGSALKAIELGAKVYQRDKFGSGYGCAILKALEVAKENNFDFLAFMDCDCSYNASDLKKLIDNREGFDLIVGNRIYQKIAPIRRIGNVFHNIISSILFRTLIKDLNSGMRVINVSKFQSILSATDMSMVAQITCISKKRNFEILEMQIGYNDRLGKSKLSIFIDGVIILRRIFIERIKKY